MTSHDDDLRARFDALRRVDAASAPELEALMDRPVVHRRPAVLFSAGALAAAAAAAVVFLVVRPPAPAEPPAFDISVVPDTPSLLTWESPTASLMDAAGTDALIASPTATASLLRGAIIDVRTILPTGR